ncbi:MAG: TAXI family TRAP transporter solute-binding subunit, partial [Thiomargarita sp.]|nr:TAXI family TRAP transporter solute-binding subunit [Thiomargarita sp.]
QSDVLSFIRSQDDAHLKKIAAKIKMVFPLYNEEVHILATQKIDSLSDLAGATVAIGKDGSGTFLTAKVIFEITGIQPKQVSRTGGTEALNQLLNGDIDAMFYVAGYPVSLFKTFQEEKFHLLSITDKSISEYYVPSTIPANTYPFQEEAVPTVAVKAVLMTYNYRRLHCKNVGKIAYIMYHNKHWLQTNGHAKWKEVNFDYPLKQWEQYSCVKKAIQSNASATPAAATTDNEESNSRSTLRKMLNNW